MKKVTKIFTLLLAMILIFAFSSNALAANYENSADALNDMGLFKGTGDGYALDSKATRAEAAVMLVRLLGAEEEAQEAAYSHPFTDVPEWAAAHVGFMYENGLTKGISETLFGSRGECSLQMYSTFVLRALGYTEEAKDFTYATATEFAGQIGVVDMFSGSGEFKRDNMVAISYTALATPSKGSEETLLASLVEAGAIDAEAAKPYQEFFAAYAAAQVLLAKDAAATSEQMDMSFDMTMKMDDGTDTINMDMDGNVKFDVTGLADLAEVTELDEIIAALGDIKMSFSFNITSDDPDLTKVTMACTLVDGVLYLNIELPEELAADMEIPTKVKLDFDEAIKQLEALGLDLDEILAEASTAAVVVPQIIIPNDEYAANYQISLVKSVKTETAADGSAKVTIEYVDLGGVVIQFMQEMYSSIPEMADMAEEAAAMQMAMSMKMVCDFNKDGVITKTTVTAPMKITVAVEDESATIAIDMTMNYQVNSIGKDVKITAPADAADYADLMELLGELMAVLEELDI